MFDHTLGCGSDQRISSTSYIFIETVILFFINLYIQPMWIKKKKSFRKKYQIYLVEIFFSNIKIHVVLYDNHFYLYEDASFSYSIWI